MTRVAALLITSLLLSCTPTSAPDAASDASDAAVSFETSTDSAMPPLPSLDASADGG